MKKLIISALAALALLFGVTSCSGDLHDNEAPSELYIIGTISGNSWSKGVKMTTVSTGVYEITTGIAANAQVKFIDVENPGNNWVNVTLDKGDSSTSSGNYELDNDSAGTYKITFDITTDTITYEKKKDIPSKVLL